MWLDELPLTEMSSGWKAPAKCKSVDGAAIKIGSKTFERGVGTHATSLALFNTYIMPTRITVDFASLGIEGRWRVRDLWRQKDLGTYSSAYHVDVPSHATQLVRLFPESGAGLRKGLNDIRDNAVYMMFSGKRPVDKPGYIAPSGPPCAECPRIRKAE